MIEFTEREAGSSETELQVTSRITTREDAVNQICLVAGAPATPRKHSTRAIQPTKVEARYINGRLRWIRVTGLIIKLRDGRPGNVEVSDTYYPGFGLDGADPAISWAWRLFPDRIESS